MDAGKKSFWGDALKLLRPGPFRRYIVGSLISDTGTWMQVMAQGWVASMLTNKTIVLGMVNFFSGIPTLALTMFGGSLADRYDKRKILIYTNLAQLVLAVVFGWLVMTGRIQMWHIMVMATLLGICIAFEMPAIAALVPELVKHDEIASAVAMDRAVFHGSRLIGPSIAGWIVGRFGAATAFFGNAVSFLGLIVAVITLPPRPAGTKEEEEQRHSGIMDGFHYLKTDRIMVLMVALIAITTIFVFPVISPVMLPLYVKNVLHLGPSELGWLMAVSGVGSLAGALGLLSIAPDNRFRVMTGNAIAVAMGLFCMSQSHTYWLTALSMGLLAIGLSMNFGLANTIVQERAPAPLRGRISAVFGLSFFGLMPIAGFIIPGVSDLIGMRTALGVASVAFGIGAFIILSAAGRKVCECPETTSPVTAQAEPVAIP